MRTTAAIVRGVSPSLARCELTYREREPIDIERAVAQHAAYVGLLRGLGLDVLEIAADDTLPDGCFVEDTAVVLDEAALLAMPGAASRRGELDAVADALARFRPVERTTLPATIEGGACCGSGGRSSSAAPPARTRTASRGSARSPSRSATPSFRWT